MKKIINNYLTIQLEILDLNDPKFENAIPAETVENENAIPAETVDSIDNLSIY